MVKKVLYILLLSNLGYSQSINNIKFVRVILGVSQDIIGSETVNYCQSGNNNVVRNFSFDFSGFAAGAEFRLELVTSSGSITTFYKLLATTTTTSVSGSHTFNNISFPYDATLGQSYFLRVKADNTQIEGLYAGGFVRLDEVYPEDMDNIDSQSRLICENSVDEVILEAEDKYKALIYVWEKNGVEVQKGLGLTSIKVKEGGGYRYRLKKTNGSTGCLSKYGISLLKLEKIDFDLVSATGEISGVCTGDNITLKIDSIKVKNNADTYSELLEKDINIKWYRDGILINGANTKEYNVTSKGIYKAQVMTCGNISHENEFEVNFIEIEENRGRVLCDENREIDLSLKNPQILSDTYKWYKDGQIILGETLPDIKISQKGKYKLEIRGSCNFTTREIEILEFDDIKETIIFSEESEKLDILEGEKINIKIQNIDSIYVEKDNVYFFEGKNEFEIREEGIYTVNAFIGKCYMTKKYEVSNLNQLRSEIQNGINQGETWILPESLTNNPNIRIIVVNRYGIQMLNEENYNNDWAGTDLNGKTLKKGVYFYFIMRNNKELINGSITIF